MISNSLLPRASICAFQTAHILLRALHLVLLIAVQSRKPMEIHGTAAITARPIRSEIM